MDDRELLDRIAEKVGKIDVLVEAQKRLEENQVRMETAIGRMADAVTKLAVIEERQDRVRSEVVAMSGAGNVPDVEHLNGDPSRSTRTYWTRGVSTDHVHGFTTGGQSTTHVHYGTTDNGSSQTNWQPRYLDLILCQKV